MSVILWQVHRRPHTAIIIWSSCIGLTFTAASMLLIPLLIEHSIMYYLIALGIGLFLCAVVISSVWRGSHCSVSDDGLCNFGFGPKINISFHLSQVKNMTYVNNLILRGIALDIAISDISIHHNKGINAAKLKQQYTRMNCPLILEFLTEDDLQMMQDLRQRLQQAC